MQPVLRTVYNPYERIKIINSRKIVCCRICPRLRVLICQDDKFQPDFCGIQKAVINEPDFSWCSFGFIEMWAKIHEGEDGVSLMKQLNEDIFSADVTVRRMITHDLIQVKHKMMPPIGKELELEYQETI